jgi:signal transduction histidine kinase
MGAGTTSGWAWIAVRDQGPGLPDEPEGGRIGLGLSIVEQIAEAHGGALTPFPGSEGTGTTMVIWIPAPGVDTPHPTDSPFTAV